MLNYRVDDTKTKPKTKSEWLLPFQIAPFLRMISMFQTGQNITKKYTINPCQSKLSQQCQSTAESKATILFMSSFLTHLIRNGSLSSEIDGLKYSVDRLCMATEEIRSKLSILIHVLQLVSRVYWHLVTSNDLRSLEDFKPVTAR